MKLIIRIIIEIILMPRLIMNKFFNNKKANSTNKKQINNSLNKDERNKYGFPSYNYIKKLYK